jgi:predicted CoA-binding protein
MIVNVSSDRNHWSILLQPMQNRQLPDISRMQDQVDICQVFRQSRTKEAVGIAQDGHVLSVGIFEHLVQL